MPVGVCIDRSLDYVVAVLGALKANCFVLPLPPSYPDARLREIDARLDAAAVASALMGACEAMIRDRVVARVSGGRAFPEREITRTLDAMLSGFSSRSTKSVVACPWI